MAGHRQNPLNVPTVEAASKGPNASKQKHWSEAHKRVGLRSMALHQSMTKASEETGIPRDTIKRWWTALDEDERQTLIASMQKDHEARWEAVNRASVAELVSRIPEMSGRDLTVMAGVSTDKIMLLRGQPTSITANVPKSAEDLAAEINSIFTPKNPSKKPSEKPSEIPAENPS